ncbi:MAG: cobalamin-dependent protein [Clostridiales Family XIII bacterium]|jgi:methanogenic corrinoid protein MtbC1|nr:cobalamin-dependent protein [Clostridiales Family XIII bacterium]
MYEHETKLIDGFLALSESDIMDGVKALKTAGASDEEIIRELQRGITAVGDAFGEGRMFVYDLVLSASMFRKAVKSIMPYNKPNLLDGGKGIVVIGTVKGDLHNIGKDITTNLLRCAGYKVIDVGVDVHSEDFVKAVRKSGTKILALSCLLTSCFPSIIDTVEALKNTGLRDRVKVIVGGGPLNEKAAKYCNADAYGSNAGVAVAYADSVYGNRREK